VRVNKPARRDGNPQRPASGDRTARVPAIDALRGAAILAMIAYHFCFDLTQYGLTSWNFYHDSFWLNARTAILSSFLLISGVSLVLAERRAQSPERFWRHVILITACAAAVSAGSLVLFPQSFIWFGVLHAIAVSLVLAKPLAARPGLALVAGLLIIAAGNAISDRHFDNRTLGWIGFVTTKPHTEDYVPLFPWTGVLLLGIAAGHALLRTGFRPMAVAARSAGGLRWLGRHSLLAYMVHQPILLGALFLMLGR
jgi:uncharacterized membrane protein